MKRFLLVASACVGLFAFTRSGSMRDQGRVTGDSSSYTLNDTTHKPKPDSSGLMVFVNDTTHKPKPDSSSLMVFINDTTHKPKPDSIRFVVYTYSDTTHKPKPDSLSFARL